MVDIIKKTTIKLTSQELAEAIVDYVSKCHSGEPPQMKPETIKFVATFEGNHNHPIIIGECFGVEISNEL